jgi:DNA invertase Pin-like site-specific DNA recombinase
MINLTGNTARLGLLGALAAVDEDLRALLGERQRAGAADAARGAGDEHPPGFGRRCRRRRAKAGPNFSAYRRTVS